MIAWRVFNHIRPCVRPLCSGLAVLLVVLLPGIAPAQDAGGELRAQLDNLAAAEGIEVTGLDVLGSAPARRAATSGPLARRLQGLLEGYNFILYHDGAGRIAGVRILGRAVKNPPRINETTVAASRQGAHYLVDAVLIGPTGLWASRRMVVDTGATTVVLPVSAISALGLREADLSAGTAQTAGGEVPAQVGSLAAVRVGQAEVKDVQVTFIADEHLGQAALLGMSFLSHFRLTIDDAAQRIILTAK